MAGKGQGRFRRLQKRRRERIYLEHFLTVRQLHVEQLIDGQDDGHEPDFSAKIDGKWIGIELTTLPRLRDRVGNHALLTRRWYWQMMRHLGWPFAGERPVLAPPHAALLWVSQEDIHAVMQKKADKVKQYQDRRPLDQVWLLIHTDHIQAHGRLMLPKHTLWHHSSFDQVWLSCYPTRHVVAVQHGRADGFEERHHRQQWD